MSKNNDITLTPEHLKMLAYSLRNQFNIIDNIKKILMALFISEYHYPIMPKI